MRIKQRDWEDADRFRGRIRKNDFEDPSKATTKVIKVTDEATVNEAYKKGYKDAIEKAVEWLERGGYFVNNTETIDDFRKAMEE